MANASGTPPEISFVMATRHPFRARLMIEDLVQDASYWEDQERLCRQDQTSVRLAVLVPRTTSDLVWTTIQDIASQDYPGHSLDFLVYGLWLRFPKFQPFRAQTPISMTILFCPEMHLFAQDNFSPQVQVIESLIHFFAHVDKSGAGNRKLRLIDMPSFIIPIEELPKDKAEARNLVAARLSQDMESMSLRDPSRLAAKYVMENLELVDSPEGKEIRWLTRVSGM